jgi:uncharacterized protein (TIGR03085 family)
MATTDAPPANAVARAERGALCDLLLESGPDAPTLCAGWTTRDLAAHLVVREGRPDAAMGIMVKRLAGWTEKVQAGAAQRPYADLVATVRSGPPRWSMMAIPSVDAQSNTIEYFIHHEDVRRGGEQWQPRELDAATVADLWERVTKAGKFFARRSPVGVVVAPTDGPGAGTELRIKDGEGSATLRGPVGEIVLALYGRVTQGLEIDGAQSEVDAFLAYPR